MKGIKLVKWTIALGLLLFLLFEVGGATKSNATGSYTIQLTYAVFDPILDGEPAIPASLRAQPDTDFVLLQLNGPLQPQWAANLQAVGVTFFGYLPDYTYLARLDGDGRSAIETQPGVRWVGSYHPAYKLSPFISGGRLSLLLFAMTHLTRRNMNKPLRTTKRPCNWNPTTTI
jgi:hypothetical protein